MSDKSTISTPRDAVLQIVDMATAMGKGWTVRVSRDGSIFSGVIYDSVPDTTEGMICQTYTDLEDQLEEALSSLDDLLEDDLDGPVQDAKWKIDDAVSGIHEAVSLIGSAKAGSP